MAAVRNIIVTLLALTILTPSIALATQRWQFMPSLTITGVYQDNVTGTPVDSTEDRESDFSASVAPSIGLQYNTYYTQALVRISPTWRYFFIHTENNTDSLLDMMGFDIEYRRWITSKLQLELVNNFIYFLDSQTEDTEGAIIARQESLLDHISLSLSQQITLHTRLRYTADFTTSEYAEPDVNDFIHYAGRIGVESYVGQNYLLSFFGGWRRALFSPSFDLIRASYDPDFDHPDKFPFALETEADYDLYEIGAGVTYRITPTLSLLVESGVLIPVNEQDGIYRLSHLDWKQLIQLEKTFNHMQLTVGYDRDITPTRGLDSQVLNQTVSASFLREWLQDFSTTFSASYGNYNATDGTIHNFRIGQITQYLVLPWMGLGAGYDYSDQQSEFGETSERITDHRATLSISFIPPRPDRLRF